MTSQNPNICPECGTVLAAIRTTVQKKAAGKTPVLRRAGDPVHDWGVKMWPLTVDDVLAASWKAYPQATERWAQSVLEAIDQAA